MKIRRHYPKTRVHSYNRSRSSKASVSSKPFKKTSNLALLADLKSKYINLRASIKDRLPASKRTGNSKR
jgi:hypothetical protein